MALLLIGYASFFHPAILAIPVALALIGMAIAENINPDNTFVNN